MNKKELAQAQAAAAQYLLDGFKAAEVGAMLGVHRSTVWRWSRSSAYRAVYERGDSIPHMGRFYRLLKRDRTILDRINSPDEVISRRAAKQILRVIQFKDAVR